MVQVEALGVVVVVEEVMGYVGMLGGREQQSVDVLAVEEADQVFDEVVVEVFSD